MTAAQLYEAELLPRHGEDEVGLQNEGTKLPPVNPPWNRPLPNRPPEPTAILACRPL